MKLTVPIASNLLTVRVSLFNEYCSPDCNEIAPFFHWKLVGGGLLMNGQRKEAPKRLPALIGEVG